MSRGLDGRRLAALAAPLLMLLSAPAAFAQLEAAPPDPAPLLDQAETETEPTTPPPPRPRLVRPRPEPAAPPPPPALVAPPAPAARLAASAAIPAAELEAFVDGAVRDAMDADHVAGVAVAVVQGGQPVLLKGYGAARLAPNVPVDPRATLFRLGSISKTFTWIALLKSAERGRMRLDAPVNGYLPQALRLPDDGFGQPVLVRHLMAHTAGFEDREIGRLFEDDSRRVRPLEAQLQAMRPHRVREPGRIASYSNYGVALAGAALARAEGRPFEALVEAEVLGPMGLTATTFREPGLPASMPAPLVDQLAAGHRWTGAAFAPLPFEHVAQIAPAGSASGTAEDMARYMLVLLAEGLRPDGAAVYGPATARLLRTSLHRNAPGMNGLTHGLFERRLAGGHVALGHDGATMGFNTAFYVIPSLNLGVFVATNTDTGWRLSRALPAQMVERFYAPPAAPAAVEAGADLSRFEGIYIASRRAYGGLERFIGRLTALWNVTARDGQLVLAQGMRGRVFVPVAGDPGLFQMIDGDERVRFGPPQGRAQGFYQPMGVGAAERISWIHRPAVLAIVAALALAASIAVLTGLFARDARELRQTHAQTLASRTQAVTAVLWLAAIGAFAWFVARAADPSWVMFNWPSPWLVAGSACAFAAALLTLAQLVQLRGVWRDERRMAGWSLGRRVRHTTTVMVFLAFGIVLAFWSALEPWSG